ncbi:MAG TPA: hypothetical protein VMF61_07030 [Candidatus Acidoferrales bacterium]|nr:hypothetical protein [Candidatus Acidoferrales bacterium]
MLLAVDPGMRKAGYAALDAEGRVVAAGIEPLERLRERVGALIAELAVDRLALGRGTNARAVAGLLGGFGLPLHHVDEFETTRRARELYFSEHPPRGLRRLLPAGLQVPPRPIDDYAAILIGRRFLAEGGEGKTSKLKPPS